jgi:hypothetical protein
MRSEDFTFFQKHTHTSVGGDLGDFIFEVNVTLRM